MWVFGERGEKCKRGGEQGGEGEKRGEFRKEGEPRLLRGSW